MFWLFFGWMACVRTPSLEGQRYILEWPIGHAVGTAVLSTEEPGRWTQVLDAVGQEGSPGAWMRASVSREGDGWGYEGRWAVGDQSAMRRVVPEEPGWTWTSREGLEVLRTRGEADAEALVFSSPEPLAALPWHMDPLLWSAMLPLLPVDPGGERVVQALNVVTGRVEPFWIQARGEEGGLRRYFAHTAADGVSVWVDAEGEVAAVQAGMGSQRFCREGVTLADMWGIDAAMPALERLETVDRPDVTLKGIIDVPLHVNGRAPAVVLLHGSGPIDRDGNAGGFGIGTFRVLARAFTEAGFVVARWDKRGIGESEWKGEDHPGALDDLVGDGAAWVDRLSELPEVDPARIFVLGHSEGGILAPRMAAERPGVAGVVLLAGPIHGLGDILRMQLRLLYEAHGVPTEKVEAAAQTQDVSLRVLSENRERDLDLPLLQGETATWLKAHLAHDPRPVLAGLRCPILALWGSADLQVPPSEAEEARRVLASNPDVDIEVIPGVDHLLMPQEHVPGMGAYGDPDRRMDPRVIQRVVDWLGEHDSPPEAADRLRPVAPLE